MNGTPSHSAQPPGRVARPAARRRTRRGFNLTEAAIVMIVVGVGICAILDLLAAGTAANAEGAEMTAAMNLANNIREISLDMRFNDPEKPTLWNTKETGANFQPDVTLFDNLLDLDGCEFSPPLDCGRQKIPGYGNWKQKIKVETVLPGNLNAPVANNPKEPTARVTVTIERANAKVYSLSWIASKRKAN
jgi:hypothetical protein